MIEAALKESRGRVFGPTGAAAKLGIPRSTLESKIRSLKIDKNRFRTYPEHLTGSSPTFGQNRRSVLFSTERSYACRWPNTTQPRCREAP